jgi:hypothetical protein
VRFRIIQIGGALRYGLSDKGCSAVYSTLIGKPQEND